MALYLVVNQLDYPIGEVELDCPVTISQQRPPQSNFVVVRENEVFTKEVLEYQRRKEREGFKPLEQAQTIPLLPTKEKEILLPFFYELRDEIGSPHALVEPVPYEDNFVYYTLLFDLGRDNVCQVVPKRYWYNLFMKGTKLEEISLEKDKRFKMTLDRKLGRSIVRIANGQFSLRLSREPVMQQFWDWLDKENKNA